MLEEIEPVLRDDWHAVLESETLARFGPRVSTLFGTPLRLERAEGGAVTATDGTSGAAVAVQEKYGLIWACLGSPSRPVVEFPECAEPDRHVITGGSVGVNVSGLRAVENFLDIGHFPFVHTGYLGIEPHAEVKPYRVEITAENEVLATGCRFFQPVASPTAEGGIEADYVYRVVRPYTVVLGKSNPLRPGRMDFIALMVQPVGPERCVAHSLLAYLKDGIDAATVRWFMQLIFLQDKPILENQVPLRLPLDPRAELMVRSDASSAVYRRWLRTHNIRYGAVAPA